MGAELFFFRLYFQLKRPYWIWLYPFHIGSFLLVGWLMLLLIGALVSQGGTPISANSPNLWGILIYYLTLVTGIAGAATAGIGAIGLLVKRLTDKGLKIYAVPLDYLNLALILAIILSNLISWLLFDREFGTARAFAQSLIALSSPDSMNPAFYAAVVLISIFLIYSPFTRMTHYIAKYFTYHKVQWDDTPNSENAKIKMQVRKFVEQIPDWSSPHIGANKNWGQIAARLPDEKQGEAERK
jgi:nitrate reductase gamma subunit